MERVVTVNLNGNSYQLEEPAYAALRAYISSAEAALTGNPDKAEVVRDLEQAIADKCSRFLSPGKTVISTQEMAQVLEEMGPVEGESPSGQERADTGQQDGSQKRLYRIRDGAMLAGICTGLAAYLNVDVAVVRILAVILGFITGGWLLLAYLIAMFIIPSAQTSEEWASAHGMPFNTQDIIERAKREYARVSEDVARDFRHSWREQRHAWRKSQQAWRQTWGEEATVSSKPPGYAARVFAGIAAFVLSLIGAALLIAFVVALFGLINVGAIFDWSPPADVPLWLAIVVLCIVYAAVSGPIGFLRRSSYAAASGYTYRGRPSGDFIALLAILAGGALAYQLLPEFRHWIEALPNSLRAFGPTLEIL